MSPRSQSYELYAYGKVARKEYDAKQKQAQSEAKAAAETGAKAKGTGGVYFTDMKGHTVAFDEAKQHLTPKQKAGVDTAKFLNKLGLGGEFVFFRSERINGEWMFRDSKGNLHNAPNGMYTGKDGRIYIDLNTFAGSRGATLYTLAHELTHFIENNAPEQYKVLADFLINEYDKTGKSMDERVKDKQKELEYLWDRDVSYDEAFHEVVADSMQKLFNDGNLQNELVKLKQSSPEGAKVVQAIKDFLDKLIKRIRNIYAKLSTGSEEAETVAQMGESLQKLQKIFAAALVEASDNYTAYGAVDIGSAQAKQGSGDGFVGSYTGTTYTQEQVSLLAAVSLEGIQNATDLAGNRDVTFSAIGINDLQTKQAWIDAGLADAVTDPDGDVYYVVNDAMLMDERERRQAQQKSQGVQLQARKKSNKTDFSQDFDYSALNWAKDLGIITGKDRAIFERTINNEIFRGAEPQSANGEYIIDTGKCLMFTDGDFHNPSLSRVIVFSTEYESLLDEAKRRILYEARSTGDVQVSQQIIEDIYGPGFAIEYTQEVDGAYAWQNRGGKGSNRGGTNQKARSLKERLAEEGISIDEDTEFQARPQEKSTSRNKYSYEELISKPDMVVIPVGGPVPTTRAEVANMAKKNAAGIGKYDPKTESVSVYVKDIETDVVLSTKGLRHGLRRTQDPLSEANYIVTVKAGEILKNSIRINEITPADDNAKSSYVLMGAAKDQNGTYIVRFVVNHFDNNIMSMDVLYAINAKKELAAHNAPRLAEKPLSVTSSTISIVDLLDVVNQYFPDILPEDVLKHYGYDSRPAGDLGDDALYQARPSEETSNRYLLANALESAAQTDEERQKLQQYRDQIQNAEDLEDRLDKLNRRIFEYSFAPGPRDTAKLNEMRETAKRMARQLDRMDKRLLGLEATKPMKDLLERERKLERQRTAEKYREASQRRT